MGLLDEILQHFKETQQRAQTAAPSGPRELLLNHLPGGDQFGQNIPVASGLMNAMYYPADRAVDLVDAAVLDPFAQFGKMLTGAAGAAGNDNMAEHARARANRDVPQVNNPLDMLEWARQANEGAAETNPYLTGMTNLAVDPSNFITPFLKGAMGIDTAARYASAAGAGEGVIQSGMKGLGVAARSAAKVQKEAMAGTNVEALGGIKGIYSDWKGALVNKPRNSLMQDPLFNSVMARYARLPKQDIEAAFQSMVDNSQSAQKLGTPIEKVMPQRTEMLKRLYDKYDNFSPAETWGNGFVDSGRPSKVLDPKTSMALQMLYGAAKPSRIALPGLGTAVDAAIGYARPGMNEFMSAGGHMLQSAFRSVADDYAFGNHLSEQAPRFLNMLKPSEAAQLESIAASRKAVMAKNAGKQSFDFIADNALFTPNDVLHVTGGNTALAEAWQKTVDVADTVASKFTKDTFGDFAEASRTGKGVDQLLPFMTWIKVAYPRLAKVALSEPGATGTIIHGVEQSKDMVDKRGLPGYNIGSVPIDTKTPYIGDLVKNTIGGGRDGTAFVDPLGVVSPIGGDVLNSQENPNDTGLDKVMNGLGQFGVPGLNPLAQNLAYAAGLSNKTPGNLSGYAGIESAMPGPEMPSVLNEILTRFRTAQGLQPPSDPIVSAAKQMVFQATGKPVDHPDNKHYALDIQNRTGIYQRAKAAVEGGGAARNAIQFVDPLNINFQTEEANKYGQAKADEQSVINGALERLGLGDLKNKSTQEIGQQYPQLAADIRHQQDTDKKLNPILDMYTSAPLTTQEKQDPRLTAWELQHNNIQVLSPTLYSAMRDEFMAANGIKDSKGFVPSTNPKAPSTGGGSKGIPTIKNPMAK